MWLLLSVCSALSAVGFSALADFVFQPGDEGDVRVRQANLVLAVLSVLAAMLCALFLLFWLADLVFAPLQGFEGHGGGGMD